MSSSSCIGLIIAVILLVLLALLVALCPGEEEEPLPPNVYAVLENSDRSTGFNVLFLGDGFGTAGELQSYRAAVESLVDRLLLEAPFCHHDQRLNFYRVDVVDTTGVAEGTCSETCAANVPLAVDASFEATNPTATIVVPGEPTYDADLGVQYCWTDDPAEPSPCRLMWPGSDGLDIILELASLGTEGLDPPLLTIHAVVVLANRQEADGGGHHGIGVDETSVVVMGVPMQNFATEDAPDWDVKTSTVMLLTHELGHALGLYDEYDYNIGLRLAPSGDRNIWDAGPPETWISTTPDPPWHTITGCLRAGISDCTVSADVTPTSTEIADAQCSYISQNTQSTLGASLHQVCDENASAWQGAFYHETLYFRFSDECRLLSLGHDEFCEVCTSLVHDAFCAYGDAGDTCADGYTLASCPVE